ncbi:hypothetical protein A3K86_12600 [Photobacterium jeanii]|uniref:Uncharacterized protein n=1 Tax=Photobacterium jeanii TaxID=858640 RepID=A0A178KAG0_9GAMM|nr:hypothetical protein [Photobacterium jeanii]OAN14046.1 hypothetical protein A3K86_12600 [Photobacterium jeanii]PST86941.1 hypothetical protein C9I91_20215 [Photobacterium jeanii]
MKFFYERTESEREICVVIKPHSLYLMFGMLAVWLLNDFMLQSAPVAQILMPAFLVFIAVRFFTIIKVHREILVALKQGRVKTQGSKFSFNNPLTYVIQKEQPASQSQTHDE